MSIHRAGVRPVVHPLYWQKLLRPNDLGLTRYNLNLSRKYPRKEPIAMKITIPDWKTSWFESHISDRFFQEMVKIEKGTAMTLETSSQWMAQVMSETGQLAQALMNL